MPPAPFFREAGSGPGVVCVHSNASTSGQWRGLMDLLAPRFHVLAADTYGAGRSPPWPQERKVALRDEVALLDPVFARAGDRFSLVGHSYGGGIALLGALVHRHRLHAMRSTSPALFSGVEHHPLLVLRRAFAPPVRIGRLRPSIRRRGTMLMTLMARFVRQMPDRVQAVRPNRGTSRSGKPAVDEPTRCRHSPRWMPRCALSLESPLSSRAVAQISRALCRASSLWIRRTCPWVDHAQDKLTS